MQRMILFSEWQINFLFINIYFNQKLNKPRCNENVFINVNRYKTKCHANYEEKNAKHIKLIPAVGQIVFHIIGETYS